MDDAQSAEGRLREILEAAERMRHWPDSRSEGVRVLQDEPALYYRFLFEVSAILRPAVAVELGTRNGCSAAQIAHGWPDCRVVTVDIEPAATARARALGLPNLAAITGDSRDPATVARVTELAPGGLDLLFIDSEHYFDLASAELAAYWPLLRPRGVAVFDDITLNPEMRRFWGTVPQPKASLGFLHLTCGAGFGAAVKSP